MRSKLPTLAVIITAILLSASGICQTKQPAKAANKPAATSSSFAKLKGNWLRTDAAYVLSIKSVAADGSLDVAYLNPNPIHVAEARASRDDKALKVFVKLQDVNYPGSTYTLVYEPKTDVLQGIYRHAGLNRDFDVVFAKAK